MAMELLKVAQQIINDEAVRLFTQECGIHYPVIFENKSIKIYVQSQRAARVLSWQKCYLLSKQCISWNYQKVEIYSPPYYCSPITINPYAILTKYCDYQDSVMNKVPPIIAKAGIQFDNLKLSQSLLPIIIRWIENPNIKGAIVRISDERQIVLTEASAALISGTDLLGATKRKRSDYWYLSDLSDMRRETKQRGDSPFEFRWRGTNEQRSQWTLFVSSYYIVCDEFSNVYQISENIGAEQIIPPPTI
ncbi:hypothetical protein [Nostoc sp. ChiQUE01b]|uniref:hypothetical protein n=1 Tax=Nostoc sp. ChiQUE01b TaxID=3075376 RepID=UPI002AD3BA30|nr:hypothetical protein [Nostoc sp. ChiQUE01b]MDZ8262748.1 hypothetical protein [Nostoc sp. ChiQUE01b]